MFSGKLFAIALLGLLVLSVLHPTSAAAALCCQTDQGETCVGIPCPGQCQLTPCSSNIPVFPWTSAIGSGVLLAGTAIALLSWRLRRSARLERKEGEPRA